MKLFVIGLKIKKLMFQIKLFFFKLFRNYNFDCVDKRGIAAKKSLETTKAIRDVQKWIILSTRSHFHSFANQ